MIERLWRWRATLMTVFVAAVASVLRLVGLSHPRALVFDEVYYVRGAYSLLELGYEGNWDKDEGTFAQGDYSHLQTRGDYVVHPMVGKLLIAAGMRIAGVTPFGWRIATAVVGILTVVIVALLTRSMLRSTLWGGVAGLLLATDGEAVVMSRTALLDNFLAFFVVLGLALLWVDRRWVQRRLAAAVATASQTGAALRAPRMGPRWWRLAAILVFGLACGTKWSGGYFAAAFLVMSVAWEAIDRRRAGFPSWLGQTFWRSAVPGALASIVLIPAVYVATWANWFLTDGSYFRDWHERHPETAYPWVPGPLRSLWHYHAEMMTFHTGLTSDHNYESHPAGWILQFRPTAFMWERVDASACRGDDCVQAISAIGTPVLWWAGLAALCYAVWRLILKRDPMGLWMSVGVLAAWVPWFPLAHRTIFTFYTVAMAPFLVMLVAWAFARIAQPPGLRGRFAQPGATLVGFYLALILLAAAFFVPLWTGAPVPYDYWRAHMWLASW